MSEVNNLLLAALRLEPKELKIARLRDFSNEEWEALLTAARRFGLAPYLFQTIKPHYPDPQIPVDYQNQLRSAYYNYAAHNMRLYRQLEQVAALLNRAGLPMVLLKGAHLAKFVYGNLALRPMVDIDLLVRHSDLSEVHQLLLENGYSAGDNAPVFSHKHLNAYSKHNSVSIEIHFNITNPPLSNRYNVADLWKRAYTEDLEGVQVLTLSPEDLILHLCAHTCIDNGFGSGLIPFLDIAYAARHYEGQLDWGLLRTRSVDWGLNRALYLFMALTEKLIGYPLPEVISRAVETDPQLSDTLMTAEQLVFEEAGETPPAVTNLFGRQPWRTKISALRQRAFTPPEIMHSLDQDQTHQSKVKIFLLKISRLLYLINTYKKTIWLGLRKDQQTVAALEVGIRRNSLREWMIKRQS